MKEEAKQLLIKLTKQTHENLSYVSGLTSLTSEQLNYKNTLESWSVLECLEHLNLYATYYHNEISNQMKLSKHNASPYFKSGCIGQYFVKSMERNPRSKPMKSPKEMCPTSSLLGNKCIADFMRHQEQLLSLLQNAESVNLTKTRTSISISKIINLRLGDTFRFVIAHNNRHLEQIKKVLLSQKK